MVYRETVHHNGIMVAECEEVAYSVSIVQQSRHSLVPLSLFSQFMGLCCLDSGWVSPLRYTSQETTSDLPRGIQTGWPWTLTHHPHSKQCWKLAWFHPGHESSFCPTCAHSIHYPFISRLVAACLLGQTVTVYQSVAMNTAESMKSSVLLKQRSCGDLFRASVWLTRKGT